ncbi:MAG TPA: beta-ketoacyl synthase N-terminal-like domain-containing protein [Planctomycetota bacterium]|nr:beta-ketoacyl synthase N-terminal-like domain-containing protein [Planctomycetota bacterium]
MSDAIVISGLGAVTAGGDTESSFDPLLLSSRARAEERPLLGSSPEVNLFGHHVDDPPFERILGAKGLRSTSREARLLQVAATFACGRARWDAVPPPGRLGVVVGTSSSGLDEFVDFYRAGRSGLQVNPARGPLTGFNAPASLLSMRMGATGLQNTISSGRTSSLEALLLGARQLRASRSDSLLVGGVDVRMSAHAYGDGPACSPARRARPFDRRRDGAVPGEAAAVLALERRDDATSHPASALAEILGSGGSAFDATSPTAAAMRALRAALDGARVGPRDVDAVFASASGDVDVDRAEGCAVHESLGDSMPVCAIAGALGDCLGASGALQVAAACASFALDSLPPVVGFEEVDESLPSLRIVREATELRARRVIVLSVDPRGHAAAVVLGRASAA